jgi:hypothetical protein
VRVITDSVGDLGELGDTESEKVRRAKGLSTAVPLKRQAAEEPHETDRRGTLPPNTPLDCLSHPPAGEKQSASLHRPTRADRCFALHWEGEAMYEGAAMVMVE